MSEDTAKYTGIFESTQRLCLSEVSALAPSEAPLTAWVKLREPKFLSKVRSQIPKAGSQHLAPSKSPILPPLPPLPFFP